MTSRERVEAALKHTEPDRTPVFEYSLDSPIADILLGRKHAGTFGNWLILAEEKGLQAAVRQRVTDILDLAVLLEHDLIYVGPNPIPEKAEASTASVPEPTPDDPIETVRIRNKRTAEAPPELPEQSLLIYIYLKEEMQRRGLDLPIIAPAYTHGVWADVDLLQTMLLAPEVAHEHFSLATRRALASVEAYLSLGIDQIGVGGDFAGNVLIISPQAYREFIVPEVRTVSRRIHAAGGRAINASDGNLWPVLDDFLIGCEVDGYLEIDSHAGMDLRKLKAQYGERITFYGNLDCGNILSFATPDDVRRHTIECLEAGMGNGGHILTASNVITAAVPLENYLAVVAAYRDMFGLPALVLGNSG